MEFWRVGIVTNALAILALLAIGSALVQMTPALRRLSFPPAIIAGALGLVLGDSAAGVLPVDTDTLETIVYHAFAVVFIAVGLQAPPGSRPRSAGARALALAIPTVATLQAILGFVLVLAWWFFSGVELHPGFGWMITLGFSQGPGQALAIGGAWEPHGLIDGAQIGLVFAAIGFAYCGLFGIPLVAIARRRGWIDPPSDLAGAPEPSAAPARSPALGGPLEPLTTQVLAIGSVYVAVFGVLTLASLPLPDEHPMRATFWGFHFVVGAVLAIAVRRGARRLGRDGIFHDDLLARLSVLAVEIATAAAIAAVRLDVLGHWLVPVLSFTAIAAVLTLVGSLWLSRRVFPQAPFTHCLVLFGLATGTISTGLVLVRMVDPELRGPVASNVVLAAAASIVLGAPLFLGILPLSVDAWSSGLLPSIGRTLLALVAYLAVLAWAWRRFVPLVPRSR